MPYYAVRNGLTPGIYDNWIDCKNNVNGVEGAVFKKFDTYAGAQSFLTTSNHVKYFKATSSHYSSIPNSHKKIEDRSIVYTDGSCKGPLDKRRAGYGVYWGEDHPWNLAERVEGRQTNIKAELDACSKAIEQAIEKGVEKILIKTDSQFTINVADKWLYKWRSNGFKLSNGKDVENPESVARLSKALLDPRVDVKFEHVPGHQGHYGNEQADKLANMGADKI